MAEDLLRNMSRTVPINIKQLDIPEDVENNLEFNQNDNIDQYAYNSGR